MLYYTESTDTWQNTKLYCILHHQGGEAIVGSMPQKNLQFCSWPRPKKFFVDELILYVFWFEQWTWVGVSWGLHGDGKLNPDCGKNCQIKAAYNCWPIKHNEKLDFGQKISVGEVWMCLICFPLIILSYWPCQTSAPQVVCWTLGRDRRVPPAGAQSLFVLHNTGRERAERPIEPAPDLDLV